jgi:hypothetical protein
MRFYGALSVIGCTCFGLVALFGCGGGGGGGGGGGQPPNVGISVDPTNSAIRAGASQAFTAIITGTSNTSVSWSITEGAAGGSITAGGTYTAPGIGGTYHVVATSQADNTKTASAAITVRSISVAPNAPTIPALGGLVFSAALTNTASQSVTWSIQEAGGGVISTGGVYAAPLASGTFHITATSLDDPGLAATTTVTVQAGSAGGTIQ